jgi:uridine kinase
MHKSHQNTVIAITGGSGSGKSSFIRKIRKKFTTDEVCIISQDEYYIPRSKQLKDKEGFENFDLPSALDLGAFHSDLLNILSGHKVTREQYVYNNDQASSTKIIYHPAPVVILEGLFVLTHEPVLSLVNYTVYMHAKENLKVIRRIKRDQIERNYPVEVVLYRYQHHVMPSFDQHIKPFYEAADIVINNNQNFEKGLEILIGFIKNRLSG